MAAPTLPTKAQWIAKTKRTLATGRSDELVIVDDILAQYEKSKKPEFVCKLNFYLDQWVAGKMKLNNTTGEQELKTIRNYKGAVTDLIQKCGSVLTLTDPVPSDIYAGILIGKDLFRGDHWVCDGFIEMAKNALRKIDSKPLGKKLLTEISAQCTGNTKVVIEFSGGSSNAGSVDPMSNDNRAMVQENNYDIFLGRTRPLVNQVMQNPKLIVTYKSSAYRPGDSREYVCGAGTSTVAAWNPTFPGMPGKERPPFIALAHELVHAHHFVHGSCYRAANGGISDGINTGIMEEEMRTVGFGAYANEELCENSIRGEHGVPERKHYVEGQDWSRVASTVTA